MIRRSRLGRACPASLSAQLDTVPAVTRPVRPPGHGCQWPAPAGRGAGPRPGLRGQRPARGYRVTVAPGPGGRGCGPAGWDSSRSPSPPPTSPRPTLGSVG
eukprot:766982-Hanusia_phi.AAC.3